MQYIPQKVEKKWRGVWERKKLWKVDIKKAKRPYYNLMMFPYPSAEGLHVGNVYAFTGSDIHGRFQRMQGFDVFEPMGFDSFGIHSENFAIKKGIHPKVQTAKNIKHFTEQLKQLGSLFAWDHAVTTSEPEYYKWTQWLFLQLYKAGLVYRAKAPVDWCPSCKTVLADEQVINGKCERCSSEVLQKETEQWFFKITKYADRLLKNLETIDWSERTKIAQKNWIGKSYGINLDFEIENSSEKISVFTTRVDTIFSGTFLILAPEHPLARRITTPGQKGEVERYLLEASKKNELERTEVDKNKTGVFTGAFAINPANKERMPVWIADFVLASYGTGAVFADAHDERDFEFAKQYGIPLRVSLRPKDDVLWEKVRNLEVCYPEEGTLVNSMQFDGLSSAQAREKISEWLEKEGAGKRTANYHLRDWLISRQRYWGPPIPIIYCAKCGTIPVPEKDLPVKLPFVKDYRPEGTGKSPLASVQSFVNTKCPQCKGPAQRETDVSDTFLDSAWYFFRYPSSSYKKGPFDETITAKWLPVDMYIGGQEHAVLHLLYTRFVTMALHDLGFADFEEPFKKFRAHGLITKEGAKMSKSKGNVVNPDEYFTKYGADTVRMYLMFIGPLAEAGDWSDKGIVGISRFLNRVWTLAQEMKEEKPAGQGLETVRHKTIKKMTEDIQGLRYNTAIAALMEYLNEISGKKAEASLEDLETLLILLSPLAPYLPEELWSQLGHKTSVHNQPWPVYDPAAFKQETVRIVLQVDGRVRDVLELPQNISETEVRELALRSEKIRRWVADKQIRRIVFVPGRLLNIVL
jgi:leucyl-tRNA synthetase